MAAKWGSCLLLIACLAMLSGCRTPTPNLKPDKAPETLNAPPQEARYETTGYPKQAFSPLDDPAKQALDSKGVNGAKNMSMGSPGGMSSGSH